MRAWQMQISENPLNFAENIWKLLSNFRQKIQRKLRIFKYFPYNWSFKFHWNISERKIISERGLKAANYIQFLRGRQPDL